MCHYFMSLIKSFKNKKSFLSDKNYAILLWVTMGMVFLFASTNSLKKYIEIPLFLFFFIFILGFFRQSFVNFFNTNKNSKLMHFLLCLSIYFFVFVFGVFIFNFFMKM